MIVLLFQFKTSVSGIWKLITSLVLSAHAYCRSLNMHGHLSSGAKCLNFGMCLYLHHSLCVRAVKAVAMLHTSAGASAGALAIQIFDEYQTSHEYKTAIFLHKSFAQSYWSYSDLHTRNMNMIDCIH